MTLKIPSNLSNVCPELRIKISFTDLSYWVIISEVFCRLRSLKLDIHDYSTRRKFHLSIPKLAANVETRSELEWKVKLVIHESSTPHHSNFLVHLFRQVIHKRSTKRKSSHHQSLRPRFLRLNKHPKAPFK
ncbi:hypothetical protein AVEN_255913-1 [Araneus ventricosus]|uniref:Uncharacterized protein n=1 Tax=Araneus ventricosus TaxID=182803 RepID=A0A4Y2E8G0_ARAVE|nr:hypothetical protein AVEN_232869-1 [Araneus ventricosus]GBM24123.1 hypothetical protein AVEN_31643-1 [Araneus ventricosus]GBM24616.1 hypothetical protein AVEN_252722-1 [Araneus ventricosus]GBM25021.1 hypothetical protein AVEN_255913-1 [Araneus ventricosus]